MYSHSYLGLGLWAARKAVLELENNSDVMSSGGEVTSSCMTSQRGPKSLSLQGKEFKIFTRGDGLSSYAQCTDTVKQMLQVTGQRTFKMVEGTPFEAKTFLLAYPIASPMIAKFTK